MGLRSPLRPPNIESSPGHGAMASIDRSVKGVGRCCAGQPTGPFRTYNGRTSSRPGGVRGGQADPPKPLAGAWADPSTICSADYPPSVAGRSVASRKRPVDEACRSRDRARGASCGRGPAARPGSSPRYPTGSRRQSADSGCARRMASGPRMKEQGARRTEIWAARWGLVRVAGMRRLGDADVRQRCAPRTVPARPLDRDRRAWPRAATRPKRQLARRRTPIRGAVQRLMRGPAVSTLRRAARAGERNAASSRALEGTRTTRCS